jgi:hypothetical protein
MEPVRCANCQALQRRLHDLQAEIERLRRQLDEATRARKRQAAPFAKGQPSVWRTCWQQGRSALDYLSQILRGTQSQDCAPSGLNVRLADSAVAL